LIEGINIPSPWGWCILAALFAFAAGSWGVGRLRAALVRPRARQRERAAGKASTARRR